MHIPRDKQIAGSIAKGIIGISVAITVTRVFCAVTLRSNDMVRGVRKVGEDWNNAHTITLRWYGMTFVMVMEE
jgi:hypothetical protein